MKELKCPICGEPTKVYLWWARKDNLCSKHASMLKAKEISLNEDGYFIDTKTKKILNKNIARCVVCGEPTKPGYYFCPSCFGKNNKKELWVKFIYCKPVEVSYGTYECRYKCNDGHVVKSKSERDIDNFLFENGITHIYEKPFTPKSNPTKPLKPDFTLPNYKGSGKDVFIEHWGYNENNIEYTKSKKYRLDIYRQEKVTVISTYEKDIQNYKESLKKKLDNFEYDQINFDEENGSL